MYSFLLSSQYVRNVVACDVKALGNRIGFDSNIKSTAIEALQRVGVDLAEFVILFSTNWH